MICFAALILGLVGIMTFSSGVSYAGYRRYLIGGIVMLLSSAGFTVCVVNYLRTRW